MNDDSFESPPKNTSMYTLILNGQPLSFETPWTPLTIASLLERQGYTAEAVATALNGNFISRAQRDKTPLQSGDHLTVFQAIVGG
jgi:sulfur carrier protein